MKISASLALAIAAATRAAVADEGFIGQDSTVSEQHFKHKHRIMPVSAFRTSSRPDIGLSGSPRRRSTKGSLDKTYGSSVAPGTPLSKAQQEARRDSKVGPLGLDGQAEPRHERTYENFALLAKKMRLHNPQLDIFHPEANPCTSEDFSRARPPGNLRALIILVILFLIVFGSIYALVEYLLFATRASACTPSTVYIPVTRYVSTSAAAPEAANTTTRLTIYSTATEFATSTSYVTLQPAVMATGLTASGGPSYYFTTNSAGSTDWLNGVSPPATASLTVITRSIFVTPVMPTASLSTTTATITSTATIQQTITVPAYTSTTFSFVEPDTTVTSTSTRYVTYTVSRVSTTTNGAGASSPKPSYSGPGASGWNSSASAPNPTGVAAAADADPRLTTMTELHYWGEGDTTTSTMTSFITTSMRVAFTTVVTPSIPEPSDNPELVTTVTALPVTITYSAGQGFSTSIAFNGSAVSSTLSPYQSGASSNSPLFSTGVSSSSSGSFTNATSPVTVSAASYSPGVVPPSSLSLRTLTINGSATAGPMTGSSSISSPSANSSVTTAPGLISTSTSVGLSMSELSSTMQVSLSSTSSSSLFSNSAPNNSSSLPSSAPSSTSPSSNDTAGSTAISTSSVSAVTTALATSSTAGQPGMSPPEYGTFTPSSSSGFSMTAGAISSSSTSSSSSLLASSTTPSSLSTATQSSLSSLDTLSTSIRTISSSTLSTASPLPSGSAASSPSATMDTGSTGPTTTIPATSFSATASGTSSLSTLASSSVPASSNSLSSYSTAFDSTSTTSITGIPASAASSMPTTGCGEYGDFMLDFDNLPNFMPSSQNQTDITQAPPIPNPYHHFTFNDGYVYAPDPKVPYEPVSPPHLAVFVGNGTGMRASQAGHTIEEGEFADGPYESSSAFWFDAFSAWLGCDNEGPEVCTLVMSAYTYSAKENDEVLAFTQNTTVPGCPGFKDCKLSKVEFPETFKGLSGLQIQAYVGEEERMFFMDDVAMRWTDNSCAAGLARQRAR